jgi:hypothetical protein
VYIVYLQAGEVEKRFDFRSSVDVLVCCWARLPLSCTERTYRSLRYF